MAENEAGDAIIHDNRENLVPKDVLPNWFDLLGTIRKIRADCKNRGYGQFCKDEEGLSFFPIIRFFEPSIYVH